MPVILNVFALWTADSFLQAFGDDLSCISPGE